MRGCAPARVDAAAVIRMAPGYAAGGRRGRQGRHCICAFATVIVEAARSYDRRCDGSDCARDRCRHVADGAARGDGGVMITVPVGMRVLVVTKPVDFRKGATGLRRWCARRSARIRSRGRSSKRADRVKILAWDGLAWCCSGNGWSTGHFGGRPIGDGIMRLSASQARIGRGSMRAMLYGRTQRHERCDFLNYAHDADHNGTRVNYSSVACERDRTSASYRHRSTAGAGGSRMLVNESLSGHLRDRRLVPPH
jgi:transposase